MWSIEQARSVYRVAQWADGYFDIAANGEVVVCAGPGEEGTLPVAQVVRAARQRGLSLPLLVRFNHILHHRIDALVGAFAAARQATGYGGAYTALYPIKVNQQHSVVQAIVDHGQERVGLESGSKAELIAVLGVARPGSVVVCNGYKDAEYVRLALVGQALGFRVHIVIDKLSELDVILAEARRMGVRPVLGVRARLASIAAGRWQNTGGDKSKFGLTADQLLSLVRRLSAEGWIDTLELLHVHMGSQVASLADIRRAVAETARHYTELRRIGAPLSVIDVGGGLGIDYEGSHCGTEFSRDYDLEDYAGAVVSELVTHARADGVPDPEIFTESGRAMTAHHAVLVTNVIDTETPGGGGTEAGGPDISDALDQALGPLDARPVADLYEHAGELLREVLDDYLAGGRSMEDRAAAERWLLDTCRHLRELIEPGRDRGLLDQLNERLAERYFCNLSVFQSLPDIWALDQVFPILPLQRLGERPGLRAVLRDLTCDSDGRIDRYVDSGRLASTLPVHPVAPGGPCLLGIFLAGAYQEILGDMHNLFGDPDSVNVSLLTDASYRLEQLEHGDSVADLLEYVHYPAAELMSQFKDMVEDCGFDDAMRSLCLRVLHEGLESYTYHEDEP